MTCTGPSAEEEADLEAGFQNPPESARPRVWWHWMNGNISKEGIEADLNWMKRVGIAGFQNFDAGLNTPQVVGKRLIFMTPEWKEAFRFTTILADSLGLEMAIAGSPGWSESGGPWVLPSQAMKKLVWSEIFLEGGIPFSDTLPEPPHTNGPFQNITGGRGFSISEEEPTIPEYYADAAVIACKIPANDLPLSTLQPKTSSSNGQFSLATLTDGDLIQSTLLPAAPAGEQSWIQLEFQEPQTMQSLTIVFNSGRFRFPGFGPTGIRNLLEASDDGVQFRTIIDIGNGGSLQHTFTFSPVTARFFRVTFKTPLPQPNQISEFFGIRLPREPEGTQIAELVLHPVARVNRFEDKAGYTSAAGLYDLATPLVSLSDVILKTDVLDLTTLMNNEGVLQWTPPDGRWLVLRLGYSLTGHQNSPASPEATGLEVDKLNRDYVKAYFDHYLDLYQDATGGLMGEHGLQYIITDSWEAGVQNWTDDMMGEFSRRRGYDMLPWLPVLTGRIVESAEASDRFLWDFRKTIADLTAEYHYDQLTTILHERGMGRYTESHESGRAFIGDGMDVKRNADIPMSATWTPGGFGGNESEGVATRYKADVRESASVAHIYGQNIVAAESMTAIGNTWAFSPERLKPTADMELACGLNRFIIHTSVHQPVNDKIPGLGLGPFGQWFTRHETWSEQALPWTTYLARSCFMLQQGKFVADILYYYGEDNNITALFGNQLPDIPEGYNYDFINSDALLNLLSVKKGLIKTPGGMSYRMMVLDTNARHMPLAVLRKINDLVTAGMVITGPKPIESPSLADDQDEFQTIIDQLWGTGTGEQPIGKGKVYANHTLPEVLAALQVKPDYEYTKPQPGTNLLFVHRKLKDGEIYWVNNRNSWVEDLEVTLRVEGKTPELWHPETGKIEPVSYSIADGRTKIPLHLEPDDAIFVVFRKNTEVPSYIIPESIETKLAIMEGSWDIRFQPDRGAPAQITLEELASWSNHPDPGVKYFSGTGTYIKTIDAPADWFDTGAQLWIDLGDVKNLAEVVVNGKIVGIAWKKPFRVDVTEALQPGNNTLEFRITNLWVNRLIGDQQPGITKKYTYTTQAFYQANSPLLPSGLLGPVQIVSKSKNETD
ncbi:MAG: glycoside hydrolase [Bacteroides sp. SM23_62_1]|nr:MAG: glycoside hydrolase [Bacteroides sp. SM23_62_1]